MTQRALISVSNKEGLTTFAQGLTELGWEILSTGGTLKALQENGIAARSIEDITKFPESFGGRVKTMHPLIMGGILFRRAEASDQRDAKELGIEPIDLVLVNLYPFQEKLRSLQENNSSDLQTELIDIGGPTLLRSAAKNHKDVTVVCDPADYPRVLASLREGAPSDELRRELAAKVFLHTSHYDAMITEYLSNQTQTGISLHHGTQLRYGENPHQFGKYFSIYSGTDTASNSLHAWGKLYQGKELSYLNILDADAAWAAVQEFSEPTAVFVKHCCPSGIASYKNIEEAFQRAYDADRLSAFGVIISLNRPATEEIAQKIIDQKIFTEVLIAPSFEDATLEILKQKPNIRVIQQTSKLINQQKTYRSVLDGMLVQNPDTKIVTNSDLTTVTKVKPADEQLRDLLFAWKAVKHVRSNAIVFVKDQVTVGIGGGQTSRVDATWIAAKRAGEKSKGAVMASDAFFPFPDSMEEAAKHGIAAIIQPGGSIRDEEIFKKADELGIAMVTTGIRAFRH